MKAGLVMLLIGLNGGAEEIATFKNLNGRVFENVKIISRAPDGIVWVSTNGPAGGGKVKFSEMDADTAARFGYDRDALKKFEEDQKRRRTQDLAAAYRQQQLVEEKKRIAELESFRVVIHGEVLQKVSDGLLVVAGSEPRRELDASMRKDGLYPSGRGRMSQIINGKRVPIYSELCLLTHYTNYARVVDRDIVFAIGYPTGEYSYTAVSGGSKTVRRFTADAQQVDRLPTRAEMDAINRVTR